MQIRGKCSFVTDSCMPIEASDASISIGHFSLLVNASGRSGVLTG